jgi:hypothetical protein
VLGSGETMRGGSPKSPLAQALETVGSPVTVSPCDRFQATSSAGKRVSSCQWKGRWSHPPANSSPVKTHGS